MELKKNMRILVLTSEVWNDKINGNNVISNWFDGFDAEFANIYGEPDAPYNNCCKKYFQITDKMMAKSIFFGKKAGIRLDYSEAEFGEMKPVAEKKPVKLYSVLKSVSGDFLRLIRELLWIWGRYDIESMKSFIDDFSPDIIFSIRMASCKMLRLEKIVSEMTDAPMVAFTGDDEYSLRQFKLSPFYWQNRFMVRKRLREMVSKYKLYYTLSQEQLEDYENRFGCRMRILRKCGIIDEECNIERSVNKPIRMIYAGKLYMNRWKALAEIVSCIRAVNRCEQKLILEIYTKDKITAKQNELLNDGYNSVIKGGVSQEELRDVYRNADIALHVESQQLQQRLLTRLSFSTKIIDCLFSGCAVMAYCWKEQSGWKYLKKEDAAMCIEKKEDLAYWINKMVEKPELISNYRKKAYDCCVRNHIKDTIQNNLMDDFCEAINNG